MSWNSGFYGTPGAGDASRYYCWKTDHSVFNDCVVVCKEINDRGEFYCPYCDADEDKSVRNRLTSD
jgi:hypothetical protein